MERVDGSEFDRGRRMVKEYGVRDRLGDSSGDHERLPLSFSSSSQFSEAVGERPCPPATCHLASNNCGLVEVWVDALANKKR